MNEIFIFQCDLNPPATSLYSRNC